MSDVRPLFQVLQQEGTPLHGSNEQGPTSNQKQEGMPAGNPNCRQHMHNATVDACWHRYHMHHMPTGIARQQEMAAGINWKRTNPGDNWQDAHWRQLPVELLTAYMQGYVLCIVTGIGGNTLSPVRGGRGSRPLPCAGEMTPSTDSKRT